MAVNLQGAVESVLTKSDVTNGEFELRNTYLLVTVSSFKLIFQIFQVSN